MIVFDLRFIVLEKSFTKNYFWTKIYTKFCLMRKFFTLKVFFTKIFSRQMRLKILYQVLLRSNQNALEIAVWLCRWPNLFLLKRILKIWSVYLILVWINLIASFCFCLVLLEFWNICFVMSWPWQGRAGWREYARDNI